MSGARIILNLSEILKLKKGKYGVASVCNGGGIHYYNNNNITKKTIFFIIFHVFPLILGGGSACLIENLQL